MKKHLFVFFVLAGLIACEEAPIKGSSTVNVPHQFKDPYIKMLDMCGEWEVTFKVQKINNRRHSEKSIKERWKIHHQSNRLILTILSGNTKGWNVVKKYEGEITGDKLTVEGEHLNVFSMYEVNIVSENELLGLKSIIFPDPANVDYEFKAKKIITNS